MTNQIKQQLWPYTFPVLSSAARTATVNSSYFENTGNFTGVRIYIEATAVTDTPSVVFTIEVRDPINDQFHSVLASAAVTAVSRDLLQIYPGGADAANERATFHVGRGFRVTATHADSDSITYGVVAEWLT